MHGVTREQGVFAPGLDPPHAVSRRVAGGDLEMQRIIDRAVVAVELQQLDETTVEGIWLSRGA
jgi:hypothetical protein